MLVTERIRFAASESHFPAEIWQLLQSVDHPAFAIDMGADGPADATLAHVAHLPSAALDEREWVLIGDPNALAKVEAHPRVVCTIDWPGDVSLARKLAGCARWLRRERDLRTLAYGDALTGLLNRRGFEEQADRAVARARYDGPSSALLLIDIDHFKQVNDRHGHAAGDAVLRHVGALIRRLVRPGDVVGRIGGEELAVLLPCAPLDVAITTAERLRAGVAAAEVPFDGKGLRVTISAGVASTGLASHHAPAMRAADEALYRAKALGRNRVEATRPLFWQAVATRLAAGAAAVDVRPAKQFADAIRAAGTRSPRQAQ